MKNYKQLTYKNMVKVETLLQEEYSIEDIAIKIGKHKTTVYRCIKNNSVDEVFSADVAWEKVNERKTKSHLNYRIFSDSILEKYILEKISSSWSPEQIAGVWTKETQEPLCHETIYQYVYKHHPQLIKLYFRRKGKKYQHKRKEKYQILNRRMIDQRPKYIENREEIGHWEGDTVIGKNHAQAIVTNVERKSGLLLASKVKRKTAKNIYNATVADFKELPAELRVSMTYDNGKEFSLHEKIENTLKMTVYFAHAYHPWERGTNENTNGLLREFIPKGTDFTKVSEKDLQYYVNLINNRPRKRLNYCTPNEIFCQSLMKSCT
jgi:IS30 family transposase